MSSELVRHDPHSTALSIAPDQDRFTDDQVAVLRHIGVEGASDADLAVFFHQVKRTGLDPFARQIYMLGRNTFNQRTNRWETKQTIQTGIDGYRLIARRAADAARQPYSTSATQWAHPDGGWRDVWVKSWGAPLAAKVTVTRAGEPFTATALFDEYVQTKKDGAPTQMWAQRPAGQLAKCAEALALRMAFPHDLAGIYVEDEIGDTPVERQGPPATTGKDRMARALSPAPEPEEPPLDDEPVWPEPVVDVDPITPAQQKALHAALRDAGAGDRDTGLELIASIIGRPVESSKELTKADASRVIDALKDVTT